MQSDIDVFTYLIVYKIAILIAGVALAYMGFRLFLADKATAAGEFSAKANLLELKLSGAAPGVFFALFGAAVICFSIFKGVQYSSEPGMDAVSSPVAEATNTAIPVVIPEAAPK
ncbi:hypothetical protein [Sphingomonas sp. SUN039]|uniref:hypothetical protein n=1 Tax=Sphingomonas sp. SUN039 TaxID=2937787 RepID=UPI0021646800|nr:hypothetical protein [Sphingomonas sp. SUN039]UVO53011.1 hypothetical protein M0209_02340 [Sphingomonas sp. SUN039]